MNRAPSPPDDAYDPADDIRRSVELAYALIRQHVAAGGRGWGGWPAGRDLNDSHQEENHQ
jgi:hypothetical protein